MAMSSAVCHAWCVLRCSVPTSDTAHQAHHRVDAGHIAYSMRGRPRLLGHGCPGGPFLTSASRGYSRCASAKSVQRRNLLQRYASKVFHYLGALADIQPRCKTISVCSAQLLPQKK